MTDKPSIDKVIADFYSVFTNVNGAKPDFELLRRICSPQLYFRSVGLLTNVSSLEMFILPRQKMLENGTLVDFKEWEIHEETKIVQHMAQRYSVYKKSGVREGNEFYETGHKFFQLIKIESAWKIVSVIWEDDKTP
ncbi:MAG TPA: hypothetical protein VK177_15650 [Flavobacteriales bacterium]|nr:hypothetical protein [Flavobacteriales bacterium]